MLNRKHMNTLALMLTAAMMISMTACSDRDEKNADTSSPISASETDATESEREEESGSTSSKSTGSLTTDEEISNSGDGEHAIEADGEDAS